ncbi:hypothetical protein Dfer_0870 [Dyadobacter fermentans DSM 18053]|uniref:Uncharacterized protein n=1 Tax=Dyadobacter fermentans (strain ATCC 700827 / DSM 18053 / CIP 107007 / KCTC 52180 / NS114) TaxID=471854 RepID=C6W2F2_DYAFD|nr:hypothetical protein Dfer_0870 [Dyadobacter fermentans DSM 18053]
MDLEQNWFRLIFRCQNYISIKQRLPKRRFKKIVSKVSKRTFPVLIKKALLLRLDTQLFP